MSVTMNVIRDEGKRIPIELARTLYGEIGVAIEKYFEHLTYMEHFGVVPEKLRTLDRGRPWRDSQFASTRLSPSRDMSR